MIQRADPPTKVLMFLAALPGVVFFAFTWRNLNEPFMIAKTAVWAISLITYLVAAPAFLRMLLK